MTHTSMSQFHTRWGTKFDSGRLLWIVMIFQKNLLSFSSLSLVYDPYEHVPISYGVGDKIWQRKVTMDSDDISRESTVIFIIELGIWPIRACQFHTGWGIFFDSGRLLLFNILIFLYQPVVAQPDIWSNVFEFAKKYSRKSTDMSLLCVVSWSTSPSQPSHISTLLNLIFQ